MRSWAPAPTFLIWKRRKVGSAPDPPKLKTCHHLGYCPLLPNNLLLGKDTPTLRIAHQDRSRRLTSSAEARDPLIRQESKVIHNALYDPQVTLQAFRFTDPSKLTNKQPPLYPTPREPLPSPALGTFTSTNQQFVATLATQSSHKCHSNVFDRDVAMLHSWKRSFKAMVRDTELEAHQEINYLKSYTKGNPKPLVDNCRKRQGENATVNFKELCEELERHFTNSAALTQALLEQLSQAANCTDKNNARMQKLADFCAGVDCQMIHLPGLACLNYPVALRPIVEKLLSPSNLNGRSKSCRTRRSTTIPLRRSASSQ